MKTDLDRPGNTLSHTSTGQVLLRRADDFHRSSRLRRAGLTVLALQANFEEVEKMRNRFQALDTDNNGCATFLARRHSTKDTAHDSLNFPSIV